MAARNTLATGRSVRAENSRDKFDRRCNTISTGKTTVLIWLDEHIDDRNDTCQNVVKKLRNIINNVNTHIDGILGQYVVPRIHHMHQVDSIFIFCGNKKQFEPWAKSWSKVHGVFMKIDPICEALKKKSQEYELNAISISFMITNDQETKTNLDQLDSSFVYTQILKEILLTIKFQPRDFEAFVIYCREKFADNDTELKNIKFFEHDYHNRTSIWWYTSECFLYPMLNRALRLIDVEIIIKIGFFIQSLHHQIEQLYLKQFAQHHSGETLTLYRGQGLSKSDFEQMTIAHGRLIAFNNFLSTSEDRIVSLDFARKILSNPELIGILFVMTIDPSESTTPFASITGVSEFAFEKEVLFSMHSIFRIQNIIPLDENNRLFQVELTLTSDTDRDLKVIADQMRKETFPDAEGWYRLGLVLIKMAQLDKAQHIYETLLEQTTNDCGKAPIYNQLGRIKDFQEKQREAMKFYQKSLDIYQKFPPSDPLNLAYVYNGIGNAYRNMDQYSNALSSHEKALEIRQTLLDSDHPDVGYSHNNIGMVYRKMGDYKNALSSYKKAYEILKKSLSSVDPNLGFAYYNIANTYYSMGAYAEALPFWEHAVEIAVRTLPKNHPRLLNWSNGLKLVKKALQ